MEKSFEKILHGYQIFRKKYAIGDRSVMQYLSHYGQKPHAMVVACCDSRVDPAVVLQCDPGDLFVVRNVANIIPRYEKDEAHHGTSATLEFGICFLKVKHLILLGHSQCSGIEMLLNKTDSYRNDFITNWVSQIKTHHSNQQNSDDYAKSALQQSYQNCLTFPWINEKLLQQAFFIHLWLFDVKTGRIFTYVDTMCISVGTNADYGSARTVITESVERLYQVSLALSVKILHSVKRVFSFFVKNHNYCLSQV